jgi:hypothetical protein
MHLLNDLYKRDGYFFIESDGIINKGEKYEYHSYNDKENNNILVKNILFFERIKLLFSIITELSFFTSLTENSQRVLFFKNIIKNIISPSINEFTDFIEIEQNHIVKETIEIGEIKKNPIKIIPLGEYNFFDDDKNRYIYKFDTYDINQYRNYIYFLLENPEVLINLKEDNNIIYFDDHIDIIYYNIFYIFSNEKIKNNLIRYCVNKIYLGNIDNYIQLLTLLLYGYSDYDFILSVLNSGFTITNINRFLTDLASTKNKEEFINEIMKYNGDIDPKKTIIKKHFPDAKIETNDVTIDGVKYFFMSKDQMPFTNLYAGKNDICLMENKNISNIHIYILGENMKILFVGNIDNSSRRAPPALKISKIYVNECEVIKYNDINCPFKYFIPICGPYFIYKVNNIYTITYFEIGRASCRERV